MYDSILLWILEWGFFPFRLARGRGFIPRLLAFTFGWFWIIPWFLIACPVMGLVALLDLFVMAWEDLK